MRRGHKKPSSINEEMARLSLSLLALLGAVAGAAAAGRDVLNFDFSWKHTLGAPPSGRQCNCTYEEGVNYGTGGSEIHVASKEDCCAACAATESCIAWDMITEDDGGQKKGTCWLKDNHDSRVTNSKRVSGILPPSSGGGGLPNKWAQPGFDQ